jgi:NAD(P)-dependent dehydrogenase (short-subunit alcohol dehydrogenase family)
VVVADIDEESAQLVGDELRESGIDARSVRCDVTDLDAVEAMAEGAWAHFDHVDIVVNNAGVIPPLRRTVNISALDARWVLDVNVMGVWHGCSVFGRRFIAQGTQAWILNTGSENSLGIPHTGAAFYTASKHAVLGLSDVMRRELPDHISVSLLCPGMVATNLSGALAHRQERYGGPGPTGAGMAAGMDPDEVGRRAVEGMRQRDFYIVTHPPVRELVEERTAEILAAFDAQAPRFPGDEVLDTRARLRAAQRDR